MEKDCILLLMAVIIVLISSESKAVQGEPTRLGCFMDIELKRDLNLRWLKLPKKMTINYCQEKCKYFPYFGLQDGEHCFCGVSYGKHGKSKNDNCNIRCPGNTKEICGGVLSNSVYKNDARNHAHETIYVGCYKDYAVGLMNETWTVMPNELTVQKCHEFCSGFPYFGLRSDYCLCYEHYVRDGITFDDDCAMPCPGANKESCGGQMKTSMYHRGKGNKYFEKHYLTTSQSSGVDENAKREKNSNEKKIPNDCQSSGCVSHVMNILGITFSVIWPSLSWKMFTVRP